MIERIEGIVTDIVKHTDRHNVVTMYTRSRGRMAFLVPVGRSKSGRMRNAVISYLSIVGADVNLRGGKEIYTLRQVQPLRLWPGVNSHPVKASLLFFLTEFCNKILRQYPADSRLWDYIANSLEVLEAIPGRYIANFHLCFLIGMMSLVGIEPAARTWSEGMQLDLLSGRMESKENPSFLRRTELLSEEESSFIPLLLRMNYRNMHYFRFRKRDRVSLLNYIIKYYSIHLPIGTEFKTIDVLTDLFD